MKKEYCIIQALAHYDLCLDINSELRNTDFVIELIGQPFVKDGMFYQAFWKIWQ